MGLSDNTNGGGRWPNIIDLIFKSHKENHEEFVFSLCLSNTDGGYMSIGKNFN